MCALSSTYCSSLSSCSISMSVSQASASALWCIRYGMMSLMSLLSFSRCAVSPSSSVCHSCVISPDRCLREERHHRTFPVDDFGDAQLDQNDDRRLQLTCIVAKLPKQRETHLFVNCPRSTQTCNHPVTSTDSPIKGMSVVVRDTQNTRGLCPAT